MKLSTSPGCVSRLTALGSALRIQRLLQGMLIVPLLFAGVCRAANPNALIVYDGSSVGPEANIVTN